MEINKFMRFLLEILKMNNFYGFLLKVFVDKSI